MGFRPQKYSPFNIKQINNYEGEKNVKSKFMRNLSIIIIFLIFMADGKAQSQEGIYVKNVLDPIISLNGIWKICLTPSGDFWNINHFGEDWKDIQVPGECMMQGFPVRLNKPFVYKKEFLVPADFRNKIIKLRFEGIYSHARIWVNGKYICEHSGGFTAWECNITASVIPGKAAMLTVNVTDSSDQISYASGYAKHPIGGILGSVSLLALPHNYPEQLVITTDFAENFQNAVLTIQGNIREAGKNNRIKMKLYDKAGHKVKLPTSSYLVTDTLFQIKNCIACPLKWDAEHPNLYRLKVTFVENGTATWHKYYSFGFRKIEIEGNKLLVNGHQVKLRGACHHDIHPLLGRVSTPDYELKDVLLAKEANINFIRTSHYPPTDHFLQLCDEYGIYVEDETAVCFVDSYRSDEFAPGATENSSDFTSRYLSQLKEMVNNQRNHPSVLFWSIGNENNFGTNFKKSYDWVKSADHTRPVIFSYPGKVPDSIKSYDILSMHYPGISGDYEQFGKITKSFGYTKMPVIFDEWAHVPCYNSFTIKEDPNIRDFWGIGLDSMWQKTYDADGGLGGAIWGMIDETFMLPKELPGYNKLQGETGKDTILNERHGNIVGYGEWGIVDTWRRKKPEFWSVKKAYSPVRILKTSSYDFKPGTDVEIPVYNRFNCTNLNALTIKYTYKGTSKTLNCPDIPAHTKGVIHITMKEWVMNEPLMVKFIDNHKKLVDSYELSRKKKTVTPDTLKHQGIIDLTEDSLSYTIYCGNKISFLIDKSSGLFKSFETSSKKVNFSGPYLNLRTMEKENNNSSPQIIDYAIDWKLENISVIKCNNFIEVSSKGDYRTLPGVEFLMRIFADGSITTTYTVNNPPKEYLREIGIKYRVDDVFDSLSWKRIPYWSNYPVNHLSASEGKVSLYSKNRMIYRKAPEQDWQYDTKSFFYERIKVGTTRQLTRIAKATKENIIEYKLQMHGVGSIMVNGTDKEGCRIDKKDNKIDLYIDNELDYPDIAWGNYQRNILLDKKYSGKIQITVLAPIKE